MTAVNPFTQPGRWFRGNIHSHSDRSDGEVTVAERFEGYRRAGYDFAVLTDHDVTTPVEAHCAEGFLSVQGAELHPDNPYGGDRFHIVAVNIREHIDARNMHVNEVLKEIQRQGGMAVLAHPYWSGHVLSDYAPLDRQYVGIEVYNHAAARLNGTSNAELLWDAHLDRLGPTWGFASDDAHRGDADVGGGWIMVRADRLDLGSICRALRDGSFYATQGPTIESIQVDRTSAGLTFDVRCSPANRIRFKGRTFTGGVFVGDGTGNLTQATYLARGNERYVRVEVEDVRGRRAWSNPFDLSDWAI